MYMFQALSRSVPKPAIFWEVLDSHLPETRRAGSKEYIAIITISMSCSAFNKILFSKMRY